MGLADKSADPKTTFFFQFCRIIERNCDSENELNKCDECYSLMYETYYQFALI